MLDLPLWDGRFKTTPSPMDVYVAVFKYRIGTGPERKLVRDVTLMR